MTAAPKTAAAMTAAQRACEEAYMQNNAPDHRSLYFIAVWGTGGNPQQAVHRNLRRADAADHAAARYLVGGKRVALYAGGGEHSGGALAGRASAGKCTI